MTDRAPSIHPQHLNTPRLVADATGTTVWRWDQAEPFGSNAANDDPDGDSIAFDLPLRLPGQRYDQETGLHYNYFRNYDPSSGRFAESDPVGLAAGLNTYAYVDDNPIQYVDPLGHTKKNDGKWAKCTKEDDEYCEAECGSRGVKSCRHWWYVATEVVGGEAVQGWKPAIKPSCNCNEDSCGGGCKTAVVLLGVGVAALCILQPQLIPVFAIGAGAVSAGAR